VAAPAIYVGVGSKIKAKISGKTRSKGPLP